MALAESGPAMLVPAVLMGVAQALVFPSTMALVSTEADERHLGAGMGMIGTFKNAAKITGPVAAGVLVHYVGFEGALMVMAGFVLLAHGGDVDSVPRQDRRPVARPRPAGDARRNRAGEQRGNRLSCRY